MKNKKGEFSKEFWYILIGICFILIIVIAIAFAVFSNRKEEVIEKTEKGGNLVLNYTNNVTGLSIVNALPTADAVGMKNSDKEQYFDFSIQSTLDNAPSIEYEISAIKVSKNSTISNEDIRIYLEKEKSGSYTKVFGPAKFTPLKESTDLESEKGSMVLLKTKKIRNSTDNYRLRMWLSDTSLLTSGNFSVDIVVNGKAK